jgi:hypothetical protein
VSKKNGQVKYRTPSLASFRKPGSAIITKEKPKTSKEEKKEVPHDRLTKGYVEALRLMLRKK